MEKHKLTQGEIRHLKEKIQKEAHDGIILKASAFKEEYKKQVSTALITAFGLVIALVWKDVVTALLPKITTPTFLQNSPLLASLYIALVVTIIAVIGIILISNWSKPRENRN